ncbi:MAG: polysaccharide deacetylase family protein [Verrucomicrobiota bacterium]
MRLDRFISTLVHPFCRAAAGQIPILMYHSVSDDPETGVSPYYRIATRPEIFRQHMELLKAADYRAVDLKTAVRELKHGSDQKMAVVTFDDGYRDFYSAAFPVLKRLDFTASMFLPTAFIGSERRSFKNRECLTWGEVKEMHAAGIHFGSHTVNHPKLVELDWPQIKSELADSKTEIEQRLGAAADTFAYPFAFPETNRAFVQRLKETLNATGYECCVTTRVGRAQAGDDLMQLKRLPANSCDDAKLFRAKLDGAYDWLAPVQAGVKRLKSFVAPRRSSSPETKTKAAHV